MEGTAVIKLTGMFSNDALEIAISRALYVTPSSCLKDWSCSSSTIIIPNFLNGKNKEDLAPMTTLISPQEIPLQIISFFFLEIPECQIAGLNPKYSENFCSNWLVKPISGKRINDWKPFSIKDFNASK